MRKKLLKIFGMFLSVSACTWAPQVQAYTQCSVLLADIWAGDGGSIWLDYQNGGSVSIAPSDPNKVSVLAMAMTALVGGRTMTVRYSADGADCTSTGRTDFIGAYLK